MPGISPKLARQMSLGRSSGRELLRSIGEIQSYPDAHALRRVWDKIGLTGIVCVDGKPTVYLKEVKQIRPSDIRRHQRFVWNQGIATVLVVCTPDRIHVYSAMAPPAPDDEDPTEGHRLVETLDRTADALAVQLLIRRIETGQLYRDRPDSFDRDCAVDQYLLRSLRAAAEQLHEVDPSVPYSTIHALLGRIIFTCYLTDREIIGAEQLRQAGAAGVENLCQLLEEYTLDSGKQVLYALFEQLQPQFNGSMFDEDMAAERRALTSRHIEILHRFLRGDDLETRQRALGFWAYDFNFIPIETISAIYEGFLGLEDDGAARPAAGKKRKSGAYYTPKHLAELVVDMGMESWQSLLGKRFLDPACGSGVFLVTIFNRIAEEWRRKNPDKRSPTRWRALVDVLEQNLFGVDKDETACRITCFSLYLALLDHFEPRDIRGFAAVGRLLPNLLLKKDEFVPDNERRTILCRNFFDEDLPLPRTGFHLVTGNPPWVGRNQPKDAKAEKWYQRHVKQTLPGRQVAHAFMWKASAHTSDSGHVCLLLPSKVFFNRTDEFQEKWLTHHEVQEVLQLADLRFLLFENAVCPAIGVRYTKKRESAGWIDLDYLAPQASRTDPRRGIVVIAPEDRKRVTFLELVHHARLGEVPMVWKMYTRGTPRDIRLIDRLSAYPRLERLVGTAKRPKRWVCGQGFQPDEKGKTLQLRSNYEPQYPWWSPKHLYVDAKSKAIDFVLQEKECFPIGEPFQQYYFVRDRRIYRAPLVLISQGFTKIAFADFDVLFRDSIQSISGRAEDAGLLALLCAVMRSRLANYYFFHTAANWGMERDKVHKYELLRLPFPLPDTVTDQDRADGIIREIQGIVRSLRRAIRDGGSSFDRRRLVDDANSQIEPLVLEYYDLDEWERMLVDDTCRIVEPSATPHSLAADIPTLRQAKAENRKQYSTTICRVLSKWARRSGYKVRAETLASPRSGLGIVSLQRSSAGGPPSDVEADEKLESTLGRIRGLLPNPAGWRTYMRGLTVFDGDWIHMVKPLILRHWTRTAALNDADELVTAILTSQRGA